MNKCINFATCNALFTIIIILRTNMKLRHNDLNSSRKGILSSLIKSHFPRHLTQPSNKLLHIDTKTHPYLLHVLSMRQ